MQRQVLSRTSIFGAIILALLFVLPNLIELVTSLGRHATHDTWVPPPSLDPIVMYYCNLLYYLEVWIFVIVLSSLVTRNLPLSGEPASWWSRCWSLRKLSTPNSFGGTSLLILVGVAADPWSVITLSSIQSFSCCKGSQRLKWFILNSYIDGIFIL